jgi:hypothetical protein
VAPAFVRQRVVPSSENTGQAASATPTRRFRREREQS